MSVYISAVTHESWESQPVPSTQPAAHGFVLGTGFDSQDSFMTAEYKPSKLYFSARVNTAIEVYTVSGMDK